MGEIEILPTYGSCMAALYPNLNHCRYCDAVYHPGNWVHGYYEKGTTGKFYAASKIPDNKCPVCRTTQVKE